MEKIYFYRGTNIKKFIWAKYKTVYTIETGFFQRYSHTYVSKKTATSTLLTAADQPLNFLRFSTKGYVDNQ